MGSSTVVHDSKRDRLLFFRSDYGKKNEGEAHTLDLKSGEVKRKAPPTPRRWPPST